MEDLIHKAKVAHSSKEQVIHEMTNSLKLHSAFDDFLVKTAIFASMDQDISAAIANELSIRTASEIMNSMSSTLTVNKIPPKPESESKPRYTFTCLQILGSIIMYAMFTDRESLNVPRDDERKAIGRAAIGTNVTPPILLLSTLFSHEYENSPVAFSVESVSERIRSLNSSVALSV
jgi:hypothetical protein